MSETSTCAVCGQPVEESTSALCGECDRPFHLNHRNDVDGKDCGEVWVDDQFLALRFACFTCLHPHGYPSGRGDAAHGSEPEPPVGKQH